ncbi:MAG: hypothetical protein LC112_11130 [Flavobacteriales bacterium]|nr:hypothetical protein [Flavobacteriales bacterium]
MITIKEFPKKEFKDKEEAFKYLMANKSLIIESKKSEIYKSHDKGLSVISNQSAIAKIAESVKSFKMDDDYYYFVVNSSNILDSHTDMHVKGNWEKTVKEQQGKVYLVFDHQLKRSEIIAMKKDVEMFTAEIPFKLLGKHYDGDTYCLIYKVKKTSIINAEAKDWLEKGYEFEASVRMQYMDIDVAINSENPDMAKEKLNFETYFSQIANKEDFEVIDYFWIIKQAKNVMESSLVMFGSNGVTGRINENLEPEKSTLEYIEPTVVTQSVEDYYLNN